MLRAGRRVCGLAVLLPLVFLGGCLDASDGDDTLQVAVSIPPQRWLVEQLGGERLRVMVLVAPGESPHTYQPTDAQVSRLMASAVYFRTGVSFENGPWFKAIQSAKGLRVVDVREGIDRLDMQPQSPAAGKPDLHAHEGHAHAHPEHEREHVCHSAGGCSDDGKDPHIWLSPQRLKRQAQTMARVLCELDSAGQAQYQRRLAELETCLDDLDRQLREMLSPLRGKAFFVFHPAWGYFAHDYGLRQKAIEIEGKEPSDHQLTEIQQEARAEQIKVVLVQPQISGRGARSVAAATGARLEVADPLPGDVPAGLRQMAEILVQSHK